MAFNPLRAIGVVLGVEEGTEPAFLGSCFSLRDSTAVITAAHCVGDLLPEQLGVRVPKDAIIVGAPPRAFPVLEVLRHPEADLAILRLGIVEWAIEPFWNNVPIHGLGEDLFAYGFPENVLTEEAREPTARLFKGYVQRVYRHESHMGFEYWALELDFACPAGLSGGPVFRPGAPQMVLGVATENFESTTYLDAIEQTTRDGSTTRTHYERVLSYGVALRLDAVGEWLDANLPAFDSSAWSERERARENRESASGGAPQEHEG